jgi:dienelactone hydrolase
VTADRIALMGWSNGGSAVMATMDTTNEGTRRQQAIPRGVCVLPGVRADQ